MATILDSHLVAGVSRLKALEEEIVEFLEPSDLDALSTKGAEIGVISLEVKRSFHILDPKVPSPRKIRYLLMHVYEQLEANSWRLEQWLKVLGKHGVSSTVLSKVRGVETTNVGGSDRSQNAARFSEEHIAALVDMLASCSGKWRNICVSLNLPRNIEKHLEARLHMYDDILCLREVLHEWIAGNHKHAKPPTLENLKKALGSKLVGCGKTSSQLDRDTLATHGICLSPNLYKRQEDNIHKKKPLAIVSQPLDTEIADEKIYSL